MSILQNTRVRVTVGIVAVVLAVAAIGTGTYAAFSDTEAGPDGTVAAGPAVRPADEPGTVNNRVQGDTITISSTFNLIQV